MLNIQRDIQADDENIKPWKNIDEKYVIVANNYENNKIYAC